RSNFPSYPQSIDCYDCGVKVLLIEDDRDLCEATAELLELEGFDVRMELTADSALATLANGALPDVVLMDYGLPDMTGGELHEKLNERFDVPVVVLSGHPIELEGTIVLRKPV